MDNAQLLWGINTVLLVILGFFVKIWIARLSADAAKMETKVEGKLDLLLCVERHGISTTACAKLFGHRHSPCQPDGRGGEVIMP